MEITAPGSPQGMEVHPPEHGIAAWRDFLVHMGTITLGLLIALGLEHAPELLHEHQLLHTAARNPFQRQTRFR